MDRKRVVEILDPETKEVLDMFEGDLAFQEAVNFYGHPNRQRENFPLWQQLLDVFEFKCYFV